MFRPRPSQRDVRAARAALAIMLETEYPPVAKSNDDKPARRKPRPKFNKGTAPAFITADDLDGQTKFKIQPSISLYQRDDGSTSLFIGVMRQDKQVFTWSVRCGSPDRISLQTMCGRNLLDWPGKVVTLHPVDGSRGGRFVNLYDPSRVQRRKKTDLPDDDIPF